MTQEEAKKVVIAKIEELTKQSPEIKELCSDIENKELKELIELAYLCKLLTGK